MPPWWHALRLISMNDVWVWASPSFPAIDACRNPSSFGILKCRSEFIDGFVLWVYTRGEHGHRPHVHVFGNSGELVVWLDPVAERARRGMKLGEARRAMRVVSEHRDELLELWRQYHG